MAITIERVRACALAHGISKMQAKRACEIADERLDGDDELGVYWLEANTHAYNLVNGDRAVANDSWARAEQARRRIAAEGPAQ